ncbi:MAG: cobalt ECF transporter T component CbiQ [Alistipes sp.]|nr:cobalt ECF transporter T component CbiQ [Alistipes sp.]MDE7129591.1 cobalt ECF transporter T component CbiQ [Alistipes sp.]
MKERLAYALAQMNELERAAEHPAPLHRIDARAQLITTASFLIIMLSVPLGQLSEIMLYFIFPLVVSAMGGNDYMAVARRSLVAVPFAAMIGIFNVVCNRETVMTVGSMAITRGWVEFLSILLRGVLSVQAVMLLIRSTGFYRLCRSMQRLGVPSVMATQLVMVYRYTYVLLEEALAMSRARSARGFGRRSYPVKMWGVMIGQLLMRAFERSRLVGRAMAARGFTGCMPSPIGDCRAWCRCDTLFCAAWIALLLTMRLWSPVERMFSLFNSIMQ